MKYTLMRLMMLGAVVPLVAAAQVQPAQPAQPKQPVPKFEPRFEPKFDPLFDPNFELNFERKFELENQVELMKLNAQDLRIQAEEMAQMNVADMKFQADEMRFRAKELANVDLERIKFQAEELKQHALMDLPKNLESFELGVGWGVGVGVGGMSRSDKLLNGRPRTPWAPEDPADSLYRAAREALNRGEYRRAAQLFNEVTTKFPKSEYAQDCAYWEAFSRYRVGTTEDLRQALKILDEGRVPLSLRSDGNVDVQALRARVQGALAARGDEKAAAEIRKEAGQNSGCDREEVSVRAEALGALGQMDPAAAMPTVKKVLARRDECTVELRRRALYILGRDPNEASVALMLDVAKNDTDPNIRGEAMSWIARVASDQAVPMLEEMLRTSTDERTQRSAVGALGSIDTDRARRAVRAIIERNDAPERVRYDAILSLSRSRNDRVANPDDMSYLRALYGKLESQRLREAVLMAVGRANTTESQQFLWSVVRNQNEPASLRAAAMQRLGSMSSVGLDDIAKLYDVADSRSLREQILYALYQRKEAAAVDKMMDIARKDTDPQIRRTAITLLARRNDPRATKLLQELIDK